MESYSGIAFNQTSNTYTISVGASAVDIQSVLDQSAPGATIFFEAGQHVLDQALHVTRGDITLQGAGKHETTFVFQSAETHGQGIVIDGTRNDWEGTITQDIHEGDTTIVLEGEHNLQAGDFLKVFQDNDQTFLDAGPYDNVVNHELTAENPFRETLVRIESVDGNVIHLEHAIAYDMAGGVSTARQENLLQNIVLDGFSVTYDLDAPDANLFENTLPEFEGAAGIFAKSTFGLEVHDVSVDNALSHGLEIFRSLETHVDQYSADGAFNKGGGGNGYGLTIAETFYGTFENLDLQNVRHGFLFSSWHAEAYNDVQITFTNRDVNYHGSPDHSNTVIVNSSIYATDGSNAWSLVSPGGALHPYTEISENTNLFGHAEGGFRDDVLQGWDNGAYLDGNGGNDTLTGGLRSDTLIGGEGEDILTGGGGRDIFDMTFGDGRDTITDFQAGAGGDRVVLRDYHMLNALADLHLEQVGEDVFLQLNNTDSILFQNADVADFTIDNFSLRHENVDNLVEQALGGIDLIQTGPGHDVVKAYISALNPGDLINLGEGLDTLLFLSDSFTFDSTEHGGLYGIDILDVTLSEQGPKLLLADDFVGKSDDGVLTVISGEAGIAKLQTSGLSEDHKVLVEGVGTVHLAEATDNRIVVDSGTRAQILGGSGADYVLVMGGIQDVDLGRGDDFISVARDVTGSFSGGEGDDLFYFSEQFVNSGLSIDGGAGVDELRFLEDTTLSAEDLSNVTGIERVMFKSADNAIDLTSGLFDESLELRGAETMVDIQADVSGLDGGTLMLERFANLTLEGMSSAPVTVTTARETTGFVKGTEGRDIFQGGEANDQFYGRGGDDSLSGGLGADRLDGGDGADTLVGGLGNDILTGGTGQDTFVLTLGDGRDTIQDFEAGAGGDVVLLSNFFNLGSVADIALVQNGADVSLTLNGKDGLLFRNVNASEFTAENFQIDNSQVVEMELHASNGTDLVYTGAGRDMLDAWITKLGSDDRVDLGADTDTLKIISNNYTFDSTHYVEMKGIDILDVSASLVGAKIVIGDDMVAQSDAGKLTILTGNAGLQVLDIGDVAASHEIILEGNGTIRLADGGAQNLTLDQSSIFDVVGGNGDERIKIRGGGSHVSGGDGNDVFSVVTADSLTLEGGNGDDTFYIGDSDYRSTMVIDGGSGFDELRFTHAVSLDAADMQGITGIDRITLQGGDNTLLLNHESFGDVLEIKGASAHTALTLDASDLYGHGTVIIRENLDVQLTGDGPQRIELTTKGSGVVHGGDLTDELIGNNANDVLYGHDGDDLLYGGRGSDTLSGGSGNDRIEGGRDADQLYGGAGNDVFVYAELPDGGDVIHDFGDGDSIDLSEIFASKDVSLSSTEQAISDGYVRIEQDGSDVKILVDIDGSAGWGEADVMATLKNIGLVEVSAGDIVV